MRIEIVGTDFEKLVASPSVPQGMFGNFNGITQRYEISALLETDVKGASFS